MMCAILEIYMYLAKLWIRTSVWLKVRASVCGMWVYCWSVVERVIYLNQSGGPLLLPLLSHYNLSLSNKKTHMHTNIKFNLQVCENISVS